MVLLFVVAFRSTGMPPPDHRIYPMAVCMSGKIVLPTMGEANEVADAEQLGIEDHGFLTPAPMVWFSAMRWLRLRIANADMLFGSYHMRATHGARGNGFLRTSSHDIATRGQSPCCPKPPEV